MRRYDLLALDLDGTLLNSRGEVSARNRAALRQAADAGLHVVVCTGRTLVECAHVLEWIEQRDPVVVAGGAIIACPVRRRSLHRFALSHDLTVRAIQSVLGHDHPALVLKAPGDTDHDYLVVRGPRRLPLDPVTEWWFQAMNVRVRVVDELRDDEHLHDTVRVGACGLSGRMARVRESLLHLAGHDAHVHHFPAVVAPEHARRSADGESLHVLEMFSPDATKWSAISHIAQWNSTPAPRIAAIGDEINDLSMIRAAGLGIAMGNAVPAVRDAAARHVGGHDDDGVAEGIQRILSGEW